MKVFLDTNILFSAILFPGSTPDKALTKAFSAPYDAYTSDYVLEELKRNFILKFPHKERALDAFLASLAVNIHIVDVNSTEYSNEKFLTDVDDKPVLRGAIQCDADILISGDKHFLSIANDITKPRIMTASDFYENTRV